MADYWPSWYPSYFTVTGSGTQSTSEIIWNNWISNSSTITTSTSAQTWGIWINHLFDVKGEILLHAANNTFVAPPTPEEVAAAEARVAARNEVARLARTRARSLLHTILTPEQKAELETHKRFHVIGSKGRRYCIRAEGQAGNVDLLAGPHDAKGKAVAAKLCIHPRGSVPHEDAWLAQMFAIQDDEDTFLRTANVVAGSLPADFLHPGRFLLEVEQTVADVVTQIDTRLAPPALPLVLV